MSFKVEIEFAGLCVYVRHKSGQVSVVMPDARLRPSMPKYHPDGDPDLTPHVGYLRFDSKDVAELQGGTGAAWPESEVVYQFSGETLDLGLGSTDAVDSKQLLFPAFGSFADSVTTHPELFSAAPTIPLLMRLGLAGGAFSSKVTLKRWNLPDTLRTKPENCHGSFATFVTWTGTIAGDALTVRLTPFDGRAARVITLRPADHGPDATVRLKLANLCAENPLEWESLHYRTMQVSRDIDFKWLYHLLTPKSGDWGSALGGRHLPVPELAPAQPHGDEQDCLGGVIDVDF